jgi:hypothetical protein
MVMHDTLICTHQVTFVWVVNVCLGGCRYGDERDPEMREFLQKISPLNNGTMAPLGIITRVLDLIPFD